MKKKRLLFQKEEYFPKTGKYFYSKKTQSPNYQH